MCQQEEHKSPLTETERLDGLLKLFAQLYNQYNNRCSLEWRIHIALWALLAGVGYAILSQEMHFGWKSLAILLAVPVHVVWCVKIHIGNVKEHDMSISYRRAAERILGFDAEQAIPPDSLTGHKMPEWLKKRFQSYWWWLAAEVGTTLFVSVAVICLVW